MYAIRSYYEKSYTVISVPRKSEILSVSKEFYNKFNGDGLDVDSGILSSKPGDPFSVITSYSIHYTKLYECPRCLAYKNHIR